MSLNKVCSLFIAFCVIEKCNFSLQRTTETTIKPETEPEDFVCSSSVNQKEQNIHCEISFRFTKEHLDIDPMCINDTRNVLHVSNGCLVHKTISRSQNTNGKAKFSNTSFTCTSNSPMSVNVDFFDGNPNSLFSVVRQEIMPDEYPYTHKVTIDLPGYVAYIYRENVLIKYTIYNSDEPSSGLNVFLELWSTDRSSRSGRLYFPRADATIDISQNILHIPCFDFRPNQPIGLFRTISESDILFNITSDSSSCTTLDNLISHLEISIRKSNKFITGPFLSTSLLPGLDIYFGLDEIKPAIKELLEDILNSSHPGSLLFEIIPDYDKEKCPKKNIKFEDFKTLLKAFKLLEYFQPDNNSVTLGKYDGISINPDEFSQNISGMYTCGSEKQRFSLLEKDFQFGPRDDIILLQKERYNILSHTVTHMEVTVKCSRASRNVSIYRERWLEPDALEIARGIQFNYSKSSKRYFGSARIPVLDSSVEYLNVTVDDQKFRNFYVQCDSKKWMFYYDQRGVLYYSPKENLIICSDWTGGYWRENYQFSLHHWKCDNYYSCQILFSNCLSKETDTNTKKNCMNSLITKSATICNEEQIYTNGDFANCKTLVPLNKGIVQCAATSEEDRIQFNVIQTYFRGFDGILYIEMDMDSEPPLKAILRLTTLLEEKLITNNVVYTKQNYVFLCEAHSYFYLDGLRWFFIFRNGTEVEIMDSVRNFDNPDSNSNPSSRIEVYFHDVSIQQIICSAPEISSNKWKNISVNLNIFDSTPSQILNTESEIYISDGKDQSAACRAGGIPTPEISWTRIQNGVEKSVEESDQLFAAGQTVLLFANFNNSKSTGEYVCKARNVAGNDTKHFNVQKLTRSSYVYIYALVGVGLLLTGTIAISILVYLRNEKVKRLQEMKEIIDLLNGSEKAKPSEDNADHVDPLQLPFDKEKEIKKNSFIINREKMLGIGNFGEVYKGILEGVDGYVAFKTLRANCDICHLKALVSELKILCFIGHHDNLVTLLGAYIKDIKQGVLYVAIELCDLGSLESYLRSYRHIFQKCPILAEEAKEPTMRNTEEVINSGRATFSIHSVQSLLKWCCQLANGMEYLGSKNVIHSDLATRNILLTAEGNAKVTDFGLSRRLYYETVYVKTAKDPLPWRWLAIEVIREKTFSAKSDVWAFGITLWEMFTLGDIPYPGMEYTMDFIQELERGLRNNKPKHASLELFDIMKQCWCLDPNDRPTFSALKMIFQHAVVNNKVNVDRKILEVKDLEMLAKELASTDYVTCL